MSDSLDTDKLEREVKSMWRDVVETPDAEFNFEMGQALAERLGHDSAEFDSIPQAAIDSFVGVGHHFDLTELKPRETVLDLAANERRPVNAQDPHDAYISPLLGSPLSDTVSVDPATVDRHPMDVHRNVEGVTEEENHT